MEQATAKRVPKEANTAFLQMLGLAARARKLSIGSTIARDAMRAKKAICTVLAADISDNTKKRITDTAAFYEIPLFEMTAPAAELGHAIGKKSIVAAIAVLDTSFASALQGIYTKFTDDLLEV